MEVFIIAYIVNGAVFPWTERSNLRVDERQRKKPSWRYFWNSITKDGETGAV